MSDSKAATLREKLAEDEYTIEVKETIRRGHKVALNKHGDRTLSKEENEQLQEFLNRYQDLIIAIDEVNSEMDGFDRAWNLGRLMVEGKEEAKRQGKEFSFSALIPAISAFDFSSSLAYRYRLLYEMFPDGDYDSDYSHTTIAELAQRSDSTEKARKTYQRMVDAGIKPTERQVRAWADSSEDLESIVDAVIDRTRNNYVESVRNVCILHGYDSVPSDDEIKDLISSKK